MSSNKTTKKSAGAAAPCVYEYESCRRLEELLNLRSLALGHNYVETTQIYTHVTQKPGLGARADISYSEMPKTVGPLGERAGHRPGRQHECPLRGDVKFLR